ncbi:HEPN domain-containing protein [Dactylosporangium sp. McL0621]|uniref:HEPN domain-containing protein n=1 Tax=Dactylosporangium sp. McL0621 TaxID=3415678 RepID=UPI003CEF05F0
MTRRLFAYSDLHNALIRLRAFYNSHPIRLQPSDNDLTRGDAYLIAAHAAIEHYVEDLCRRSVNQSVHRFARQGLHTAALKSLIDGHYWRQAVDLPRGVFAFASGHEEVARAVKWYIGRVDTNNGIRRSNLMALLLPLGFREPDFDEVWMGDMDSFGGDRGDIAHGRPVQPRISPPIQVGPAGQTISITVWTPSATRHRNTAPPWEIERRIRRITPELRKWDQRVIQRSA